MMTISRLVQPYHLPVDHRIFINDRINHFLKYYLSYKSVPKTIINHFFLSLNHHPEGGQGVRTPPSLKNHKFIEFPSNTGLDSLIIT